MSHMFETKALLQDTPSGNQYQAQAQHDYVNISSEESIKAMPLTHTHTHGWETSSIIGQAKVGCEFQPGSSSFQLHLHASINEKGEVMGSPAPIPNFPQ